MAKSSTTFKKGNRASKGHGRKGFEYEQAQLTKMKQILNRALVMTEDIQLNKATIKEAMAYENTLKLVSKILDKLHANKEVMDITTLGKELPTPILRLNKNVIQRSNRDKENILPNPED